MGKRFIVAGALSAVAAVLVAGVAYRTWSEGRPQTALKQWLAASEDLDEAKLDAAIDKAAVVAAYNEQLRSQALASYQSDPKVADLGIADLILERDSSYLEGLARGYASPRGVRGVLTRCDPRTQSDKSYNATEAVLPTLVVVSSDRAEVVCPMDDHGNIRAVMERRSGRTWQITRIELPHFMPDQGAQDAAP